MYAGIHITVILGVLSFAFSYNPPYRESTVSINTKKWLHTVSDKFVSLTIDPDVLIKSENYGKAAINMAKSLSPGYLRVGGPGSDHFSFQARNEDFDYMSNTTITASEWILLNELLEDAGLNLIICLNAITRVDGVWDSRNTLQLVSFSDRRGYTMDFELGYETQWTVVEGNSFPGAEMGRDVVRLRKILDAYSRYSQSLILGPDLNRLTRSEDIQFARNYLTEAGNSLSALTLHPRFSSSLKPDEDPSTEMLQMIAQLETNIWGKDVLSRLSGKVPPRKPIWIAESKRRDGPPQFKDAISWLRRLGAGAKLGVQVMMAQPHPQSFYDPTPDFWMMTLHKALVGRQVLDSKLVSGNKTMIEAYSHCTQTVHNPDTTILDDTLVKYEKGAVTLFGVNMADEKIRLNLKVNIKEEEIHKYILTEGRDPTTGERITLFNNQRLSLSPDGELPILTPKIRTPNRSLALTLPGKCIFFVVIPDIKARTCMLPLNALLEDPTQATQSKTPFVEEVIDDQFGAERHPASEESTDSSEIFVSFRSPMFADKSLSKLFSHKDKFSKTIKKSNDPSNDAEPIVKYITFSDNNWLSDFPKKIDYETPKEEEDYLATNMNTPMSYPSHTHIPAEAETAASRREKYKIFADAVFGRRNVTSGDYDSDGNNLGRSRSKRHIDLKIKEELAKSAAPLENKHDLNLVSKTVKLSDSMSRLNHFLDETNQNKIHRLYKDKTRDRSNPLFMAIEDDDDEEEMVTSVNGYRKIPFDSVKEDSGKNQGKKEEKFGMAKNTDETVTIVNGVRKASSGAAKEDGFKNQEKKNDKSGKAKHVDDIVKSISDYRKSLINNMREDSVESSEQKNEKLGKTKIAELDAKHKADIGKIKEALEDHKRKPRSLSFQDEFFLKLLLDLDLYERMEENEKDTKHSASRIKREVAGGSNYLNSLIKAPREFKSNYDEKKDDILRILREERGNNIVKVQRKRALSSDQKAKLESYLNEVRAKLNAKNAEKVSKTKPEKVGNTKGATKEDKVAYTKVAVPREERVTFARVGIPKEGKVGYAKVAAPYEDKAALARAPGVSVEEKLGYGRAENNFGHAKVGSPMAAQRDGSEDVIVSPIKSHPGLESTLDEIGQLSREKIMRSVREKADSLIAHMRSDEHSEKVGAKERKGKDYESKVGAGKKKSSSEEVVGAPHHHHRPHIRRSRLRAENPIEEDKKTTEQKVGNAHEQKLETPPAQQAGGPQVRKLGSEHAQKLGKTTVGLERPNGAEVPMNSAAQPLASPLAITAPNQATQPAEQAKAVPQLGNLQNKRGKRETNPFIYSPRHPSSAKSYADYADLMARGDLDNGLENLNFDAPQTIEREPHYHLQSPPKLQQIYPGYFVRDNPSFKNDVYRSASDEKLNKVPKIPDASKTLFQSEESSEEQALNVPELTSGKPYLKVNEGDMSGKTVVVQVFDESGKKVAGKVYSSLQDYMFPSSYNKYLAHSLKRPSSTFDDNSLQRLDMDRSDGFPSSSFELTADQTSSEEFALQKDRSLQVLVSMMKKIMEGEEVDDVMDSYYSTEHDDYSDVNGEPIEFSSEAQSQENRSQLQTSQDFTSTTPHSSETSTSGSTESTATSNSAETTTTTSSIVDTTTPDSDEISTTNSPCILTTTSTPAEISTTKPPCILTTTSAPNEISSSKAEETSTTESSTTSTSKATLWTEDGTTDFPSTTQMNELKETTTAEISGITTPKTTILGTTETLSTTATPKESATDLGTTQTNGINSLTEPTTTPVPTEPMTTTRAPVIFLPYVDDAIGHMFKFKRSISWINNNEISSKAEDDLLPANTENDIDNFTKEVTKTSPEPLKEEKQKETTKKDPLFTSALHKHYDKMILNAPKMLTTVKAAPPSSNDLESSFKPEPTKKPESSNNPESSTKPSESVIQKIDKKLQEETEASSNNGTSDRPAKEKINEAYASFLAALANQLTNLISQIQNSFLYKQVMDML